MDDFAAETRGGGGGGGKSKCLMKEAEERKKERKNQGKKNMPLLLCVCVRVCVHLLWIFPFVGMRFFHHPCFPFLRLCSLG
jgi:hypothetical protein